MDRKQLGKKEIEKINQEIEKSFGLKDFIDNDARVTLADEKYVLIDSDACFFYKDNKLIPCLKMVIKNNFLKKVSIDKGAVKFISSGADVMRPGIVELDKSIKKGEIVSVVDSVYKVPVAVGEALFDGSEIASMKSGKVIKNLHHVGDDAWNFLTGK